MRVRRIVDLSVPVGPGTQVYPGDPVPRFAVHSTTARDGFNLLRLELGSQTGTHLDAPYHFRDDAARIDAVDLALCTGPAVVADVRGLGPRERITWEHLAPAAAAMRPGVIVLVCTGWSAHYGTAAYYDHPFLDAEACRLMLDRGVRTICLDTVNIDETPDGSHPGEGYPAHHLVATAGGIVGENFRNLEQVDFPDPFVSALPVALEGADGAPVRAVALQLEA
jgi:kynurenine formamidase